MYKFEVGQKVIFHRGPIAKTVDLPETVEATVCARSNDLRIVYQIKWPPTGSASVFEHELTAAITSVKIE